MGKYRNVGYPANIVRAAMAGVSGIAAGKPGNIMRAAMAERTAKAGKSGSIAEAAMSGVSERDAGSETARKTGDTVGAELAGEAVGTGTAGETGTAADTTGTAGTVVGTGVTEEPGGAAGADSPRTGGVMADGKSAGYEKSGNAGAAAWAGVRRGTLAAEAGRGIVWHEILGEPMCRRRRKR